MRIHLFVLFLAGCSPSVLPPPPPEPSVDERREIALTWLRAVVDSAERQDFPRFLTATGPSAAEGYQQPIWHDSIWLAGHRGEFAGICALHERCIRTAPAIVLTLGMPTLPIGDTSYIQVDYGVWAPSTPCPSATNRPIPPHTVQSGLWFSRYWILQLRRVAHHWIVEDPGLSGIGGRLELPCHVAG